VHRRGAEQAALRAAEAERTLESALRVEAQRHGARAGLHALDGRPARAGGPDALDLLAGGGRHLGARDVRLAAGRLADDARVDDDRLGAERAQAVADVGDLCALRVEGADQRDRRAGGHV
jgi:hypothetical protein